MRLLTKILCVLALVGAAPHSWAQTPPIYHCIGAHGEPVFSGQPCGTPAPTASAGPTGQRSHPHAACAHSPSALREGIAVAFADRDVNRLAGWILWRGTDQASARAALRSLSAWVKQPLVGIDGLDAAGPPGSAGAGDQPMPSSGDVTLPASSAARPPADLSISTGGSNGSTRTFGVVQFGGCWWLSF